MTLWEKTKIITESYADPEMASKIFRVFEGVRYMNLLRYFYIERPFASFSSYRYGQPFGSQANITGGKYPLKSITDGFASTTQRLLNFC
jgi:hypothetical protein